MRPCYRRPPPSRVLTDARALIGHAAHTLFLVPPPRQRPLPGNAAAACFLFLAGVSRPGFVMAISLAVIARRAACRRAHRRRAADIYFIFCLGSVCVFYFIGGVWRVHSQRHCLGKQLPECPAYDPFTLCLCAIARQLAIPTADPHTDRQTALLRLLAFFCRFPDCLPRLSPAPQHRSRPRLIG